MSTRKSESPAKIEWLSPGDAKALLELNVKNRHVYQNHVLILRRHMVEGRWRYNGETIKISPEGHVLDGQHRLHALAGITEEDGVDEDFRLKFLVVYDVERDTQSTMDQCKIRTAADQLVLNDAFEGLSATDSRLIAGAIRVYSSWTGGLMFGNQIPNRLTNIEVVEIGSKHPEMVNSMRALVCSDLVRVKARPSLTLAVMYRLAMIDADDQDQFAGYLYTGADMHTGHPVLTLRERLDRIKDTKVKTSDRDMIAFFVIAWNAFRANKMMSKFQRPHGGVWSKDNYPEPR